MANKDIQTDELFKYVVELNVEEKTKAAILDAIQSGQRAKGIQLLKKYRSEILNDIHSDQDKLYQIDFILQKAK